MMRGDWNSVGLAWLRILAGCGIASHGFATIFGGDITLLIQGVTRLGFPFPVVFAWAAALSELVGGICVATGVGTRIAAFFVFCTMSVALFLRHAADPFDVKELAYLYWAIAGALMMLGGGAYTLPRLFARRNR